MAATRRSDDYPVYYWDSLRQWAWSTQSPLCGRWYRHWLREEEHPCYYQVLSVDGQSKDTIMMHDGPLSVLLAAGSLVTHARLIEGDVCPSYADVPFDPHAAARDPF